MTALHTGIWRVLGCQALIAALAAAGFGGFQSLPAGIAAAFGAGGAVVMTALLAVAVSWLNRRLKDGRSVAATAMVLGFVPRLALVLVLFWIGLQILALKPLPMVIGFAATYFIGYLLNYTLDKK